ncbi:MAG: hypothetical protein DSY47_06050 [Hydrogenothermus sp.]|nr:MAG: hypothetical protein DSY47_06050 [Hydrogenothermus sp.]
MILKSLRLKNFLAHKDTKIEFAKTGITAFIGDNGSGKTSIIEGISFALFGKSSKGNLSDLVHWTAKNAVVELIFEKNGKEYKIYREIKLTGKSVSTTSAVYRNENGVFSLYYQKNINKELPKLIGITPKTFFSSILVKQGDIEGLLNLKPRERAKVFEDILDMSLYQLLSEHYASKRRDLENRLKGIQISTENEKEIKSHIKQLEEEKKVLKEKLNILNKEKEELQKALKINLQIENLKQKLQFLENELNTLNQEIENIENLKQQLTHLEKKAKEYEEKQEILKKLLENKALKQKIENLEENLKKVKKHEEIYNSLKELANNYEEREKSYKNLLNEISKLSKIEGQLNTFEEQLTTLRQELLETKNNALGLAKKLTSIKPIYKTLELNPVLAPTMIRDGKFLIEKYEKKLQEVKEKGTKIKTEIEILEKQLKNISSLKGECPTCYRPIEEHNKQELINEIKTQIDEKNKLREELRQKYRDLEKKIKTEEEILKLLEEFENWFEKHKEADAKIKEIKAKIFALQKEKEKLQDVLKQKEEIQKFLEKNKEKYLKFKEAENLLKNVSRKELEKEIEKLNQSVENIPYEEKTIKEELAKLKPYNEKFFKISQEITKEEKLKQKRQNIQESIEKIRFEISNLEASLPDMEISEEKLINLQNEISFLQSQIGQLEGKLKILNDELSQVIEKLKVIEDINKKIEKYKKLEIVLGAKGIQRIIRENALYELPKMVNFIFSRFGFGFNQIKFSENFDISILANTTEREDRYISIDAISGGQKVALGLALRLALSNFLSSKTDFLILDEPTIHLDQQRREELVSILLNLKNQNFLNQLIVITHDKELEDTADQIYFVENGKVFETR